jgi:hypothetical protein
MSASRALVLLVATAACQSADPCQPLAGVWTIVAGDPPPAWQPPRFDVREQGLEVSLHPMWDASRDEHGAKPALDVAGAAVRSPWRIRLERPGLTGDLTLRVRQGATSCTLPRPARARCQDGTLTVDLELVSVDPGNPCLAAGSRTLHLTLAR